jgi:hypothetical protein
MWLQRLAAMWKTPEGRRVDRPIVSEGPHMHPTIGQVERNLIDAKDTYDYKVQQAQSALRSVVGDGTGDAKDLAAAHALAKTYGFELALSPAAKAVPVAAKAAKKR